MAGRGRLGVGVCRAEQSPSYSYDRNFCNLAFFREKFSYTGPFCNFLYKWILGVGAVNYGAELRSRRQGATLAQPPGHPGIRRGSRLGAVDLGAEIGATVLGAEPFLPSGKGGSQSI